MTMTFLSGGYSVKYIPIEYGKRAGRIEVPPDQGHAPLRRPGRAHGAVVQPAAPLPADRVRAVGVRARQAHLRHRHATTSASRRTRCSSCSRRSRSSRSACSPTSWSALDARPRRGAARQRLIDPERDQLRVDRSPWRRRVRAVRS